MEKTKEKLISKDFDEKYNYLIKKHFEKIKDKSLIVLLLYEIEKQP